jgi:hypothetical protein
MSRKLAVGYIGGGKQTKIEAGGFTGTYVPQEGRDINMGKNDRPGGMDNIPSNFNVSKKQSTDRTDMGKVAGVAHVKRPDRGVKGLSSSDKGGGRK